MVNQTWVQELLIQDQDQDSEVQDRDRKNGSRENSSLEYSTPSLWL